MKLFGKSRSAQPALSPGGRASPQRAAVGVDVAARLDANPAVTHTPIQGVQFYHHENFLSAKQCDDLIALIEIGRRPSTLLSDRAGYGFRTSDSCDLDRWSPIVQPIDESIADLLGVDPKNGETMQGQRYDIGQQFRAHHDYFHEAEKYWADMERCGGQRTWTAMVFLNDVAEGGATWFPKAGIRVVPRRGLLLAWNNMKADGAPNDQTLHEGMPVVEGVKYIVTKWFREGRWVSY